MSISYKGLANLVTDADTASERLIRTGLERILPGVSFLGEESGGDLSVSGQTWVVDPLDGTTNFAHGFPWFCVSIALVEESQPLLGVVYHPMMDECFIARRGSGAFCNGQRLAVSTIPSVAESLLTTGFYYHKGDELSRQVTLFHRIHQKAQTIRRPGSAALDLAYVAAGYFDGFWEKGLAPWDVAAGFLLVREAGGVVTDYAGAPVSVDTAETLATNGLIHHALRILLRGT